MILNFNGIDDDRATNLKRILFKESENYRRGKLDVISIRRIIKFFDEMFLKMRYSI